jgi:DNA-binding response OmpR family regulator
MISVMVVERDPSVAWLLDEELAEAGFSVRVLPDLDAALADLRHQPAQVLVTDESSMGGEVGRWLPNARRVHSGPVVVLGLDRHRRPEHCPGLDRLPKSSDLSPLIASLRRQALSLLWFSAAAPVC